MRITTYLLVVLPLVASPTSLGRADPLMITRAMSATTIAEVFIERDSALVELEIGLPDLQGFRNLLPDALYERLGFEPEPLEERFRRFFLEDLTVRANGGRPILGRVLEMDARRRVRRDEVTGEPLPDTGDEEGELVVFAKLVYPLPRRPSTINIAPPRNAAGAATANIGFVTYHKRLPVMDFRYLSADETLRLDWSDPWFSRFDNRNLRRQYDSPMSAFLYVEPYEVRKEIIVRPIDLQTWVDLGLEGKTVISVDEQAEVKRRVAEFLAQSNPVTIDGESAVASLDRIHFIYRTLRTTGIIDPPRDLDVYSATLGVIFSFPMEGLPQEVAMEWELFDPRVPRVPAAATDEAGPLPFMITRDDPTLRWRNFLKNPTLPSLIDVAMPPRRNLSLTFAAVVAVLALIFMGFRHRGELIRRTAPARVRASALALALVAAIAIPASIRSGQVSEEHARDVIESLLRNTYRAFDFRGEDQIYDALENSVGGELLTDIYLETRRGLEIANTGGAQARVKEVEVISAEYEPLAGESGFVTLATWNVSGSVGHWGHVHQRTNQYEARFEIRPLDGAWKITNLQLIQETRL